MAKRAYLVSTTDVTSPVKDQEVALFCAAVNSTVTHTLLLSLGVALPEKIAMTHNTEGNDPPDIEALGLGWECSEFPPNQSALEVVQEEMKNIGMIVPSYSQAGSKVGKIRESAMPHTANPKPWAINDEVKALHDVFLEKILGVAKSKDVAPNDILLLDQRNDDWPEHAEKALRLALMERKPKRLRGILLVRWSRNVADYTRPPVPEVVQLFPYSPM